MLYSSAIQYVIFLVTTGVILPYIDRIGRRLLLLSGSIICMALHYAIAGIMATYGNPVDEIDGNKNLRWEIKGAPGKGVIACSYIFVGIYGLTWVSASILCPECRTNKAPRPPLPGSTPPKSSLSNTAQRASVSPQPATGSSTLRSPISWRPPSPTSSGRRTSSLGFSARS